MRVDPPRILVIDDELPICRNCVKILSRISPDVRYALNGYDALRMIGEEPFDAVITDLKMSSMGGMEVLSRVKESYPDTRVIVITGYATVASAVEVMKLGADDYLPKPFTPDELRSVVQKALSERDLILRNRRLMEQEGHLRISSHQLIGESPKLKVVVDMILKVAPTDSTVLIYGESGTGKELIARAIHANSKRREEVFFAVDCGTLSGNLLESELFGHTKGAFTGAHKDKEGILKRANGGTIFLDEISNISPDVQSKLLRFLENREFLPRGGSSVQKVDVRLVLATNKDLKEMVTAGTFREDFYYRIFVYPILVPPLRERKEDILPIAYHFLKQFSLKMGKNIKGFDQGAAARLTAYDWPGNVRQLRNAVERAVILCEKEQIDTKDLSIADDRRQVSEHVPETNEELKRIKKEIRQNAVDEVERNFVLNALIRNDWNVSRAAKSVGLQRSNFQNLIRKHAITSQKRSKGVGGDGP